MSKSILEQIREQIDVDDDSRIDLSKYKSNFIETMIKNCDVECPKCHQKNVNRITQQKRSADEGATDFYTCLNPKCGYTWSHNN